MKAKFKMMHRFLMISLCAAVLLVSIFNDSASAQSNEDLMPPQASHVENEVTAVAPNDPTHPPIRLTPDKSEMLRLEEDAASIIIGNESHIQLLMDSPKRLVIVPRAPGATFFTVLNKKGEVIMQRHAIVASPKEKYLRIRRSCRTAGSGGAGCEETSIYYCPGMCHDVQIQTNTNVRQSRTNLMPSGNNMGGGIRYDDVLDDNDDSSETTNEDIVE
jgi:hypothetical protein